MGCPTDLGLGVGVSPQNFEHPTSICDRGVKTTIIVILSISVNSGG